MELTERQSEILAFIRQSFRRRDLPPTCAEIQEHFRFSSPASVSSHLDLLEKKGAIRREPGRDRNIRLAEPVRPLGLLEIPILGAITAGLPSDHEAHAEEYLDIDAASLGLSPQASFFGLRVRGDSMIDAHILDGDLALLERKPAAHQDIVAALIDGETTLKRFLVEKGRSFLRAENSHYPDLFPVRDLTVQGVLRTVIRTHPARS